MRGLVAIGGLVLLALTGCAPSQSGPAPALDASFAPDRSDWPVPPRIPADFSWTGRYVVPDLGVEVPFRWHGDGGDFQMIAGGAGEPIHFTNLIVDGELYTLTYAWPGIPRLPCTHVGAFTVDELNAGLAEASYVGRETLHRETDHEVHHFRSLAVLDLPPDALGGADGVPLRIPLMAGDVYTDVDDPTHLRQLLHFGLQNLYDPNLDEWILIDAHADAPGTVALPEECAAS